MSRLTANEAVELYQRGEVSSEIVSFDSEQHLEEMQDMVPGLVGAMLKLGLPSISSLQLGHRIPVVVTYVNNDLLRIFVDPDIMPYGRKTKKGREFVELTAFSFLGEPMRLSTEDIKYVNYKGLGAELQRHYDLIDSVRRSCQSPSQLTSSRSKP